LGSPGKSGISYFQVAVRKFFTIGFIGQNFT